MSLLPVVFHTSVESVICFTGHVRICVDPRRQRIAALSRKTMPLSHRFLRLIGAHRYVIVGAASALRGCRRRRRSEQSRSDNETTKAKAVSLDTVRCDLALRIRHAYCSPYQPGRPLWQKQRSARFQARRSSWEGVNETSSTCRLFDCSKGPFAVKGFSLTSAVASRCLPSRGAASARRENARTLACPQSRRWQGASPSRGIAAALPQPRELAIDPRRAAAAARR